MARKFFTPINLTGLELTNFKIQNLGDDPTPYGAGHTYFNTAHNEIRVYDGTNWMPVGGSILYGNTASRPSAGNSGRVYADTQVGVFYIDNGTSWDQIGEVEGAVSTHNALTTGVHGVTGNVVGTSDSQELTNKTLGSGTTLSADLSGADTYTITNLVDPTDAQDAATKAYVDATAQGLNVKDSVLAASTEDVTLTGITAPLVIDTVTIPSGARVLLKDQSPGTENGIYVYSSSTSSLTRAIDQTTPDKGDYVFVESGSQIARGFIVTDTTTNVVWTQFSAAGQYVAGTGITISGTTIAQDTANGYGTRKYATTIGDTTTTNFSITHNFGTQDVTVVVYDTATNDEVFTDVVHTSINAVNVKFAVAPGTNAFRVVVVG